MGRAAVVVATGALALGSFVFPVAASADAPVPVTACGTTVTGSAYLPADLHCASGTGVTLAGAGTLELRGHVLSGPGHATATVDDGSVGVSIQADDGSVRVTGGTLSGWGMALTGNSVPIQADHLTVETGRIGVNAGPGGATVVDHVKLRNVPIGVTALSTSVTVQNSSLSGGQVGVSIEDTSATITATTIQNYLTGAECTDGLCFVDHSTLTHNVEGINSGYLGGFELSHDVISDNRIGAEANFNFGASVGDITTTSFLNNGLGLLVDNGSNLTVTSNVFSGNTAGVRIYALPSDTGFVTSLDLEGNIFRSNHDGVLITDRTAVSTLGRNVAHRDTRWGLFVAGHVTDLGHNVAYANGESAQCAGVHCAP